MNKMSYTYMNLSCISASLNKNISHYVQTNYYAENVWWEFRPHKDEVRRERFLLPDNTG